MSGLIYDHPPAPGPGYWDWRCLRCSEPVDRHAGLIARWRWRRLRLLCGADPGPRW